MHEQPFPLDYFQVLITFCDVLTEVYIKLRDLVNALPPLHSGMTHSVPPGSGYWTGIQTPNNSNNPLYSQLFPAASPRNILDLASPQPASASFIPTSITSPSSTSSATGSGIVDTVLKLDSRFKVCGIIDVLCVAIIHMRFLQKIVNQLLKELDAMARDSIRDELSSLDPLLRNTALTGSNANESAPASGSVFEQIGSGVADISLFLPTMQHIRLLCFIYRVNTTKTSVAERNAFDGVTMIVRIQGRPNYTGCG